MIKSVCPFLPLNSFVPLLFLSVLFLLVSSSVGSADETRPEGDDFAPVAPGRVTVSENVTEPFIYRLEEHLDSATLNASAIGDKAEASVFTVWPPSTPIPPLESENGDAVVVDNTLKFASKGEGYVILPEGLGIYAAAAASIVLELRVTGADHLRLYWRHRSVPWDKDILELDGAYFDIPVTADSAAHTYDVQVQGMDAFRRNRIVDGFMLFCDAASSVEIVRVEVRNRTEVFSGAAIGAREYAIGGDIRPVLFMHTPARAAYRLRLPDNPVFTAGLAAVQDNGPAAFSLCVSHENQRQVILEEDGIGPDGWLDRRADLSAFAGREVEIELSVNSSVAGQVGLWSNPCIYDAETGPRPLPNILVYLVDALRADHLDAYGYERTTAPTLSLLAKEGILFRNCFSQETCTKPSVMTLYSGIDSQAHGYTCNNGYIYGDEFRFFPTVLRDIGYSTAAISQNTYAPPPSTTQKSFDRLVDLFDINKSVTEDSYNAAVAFLEQHLDRPFFLYIHTMECHELWTPRPQACPYEVSPPFDQVYRDPENAFPPDRYDGSILYADYNFKRVRDKLEELGLLQNTLIIFTSDHGFALGERGEWAHGRDPYQDQIHVPLIMSWPAGGIGSAVQSEQVQLADLAPTLLDLLKLPVPELCQATSLLPLLRGDNSQFQDRPIFSFNGWTSCDGVTRGDWRFIRNQHREEFLYSIAGGAPETENLLSAHPDIAEELRQSLKAHLKKNSKIRAATTPSLEGSAEVQVDPVKLEILKSLGYIGD